MSLGVNTRVDAARSGASRSSASRAGAARAGAPRAGGAQDEGARAGAADADEPDTDASGVGEREDDVPWLTPVEQESWRDFLTASRLILDRLESDLHNDAGMPFAYYDILVKLSEAPERTLRMGVLAAALRSSSSRISHAISRLEACGWVRRESHPSDRRGQFAVLTEDGFTALSDAAPCHVAAVRRHLLDALDQEQVVQLGEISRAVIAAADRRDPAARLAAPPAP